MATFCLIHGAWHESSCWDELVPVLEERGHRVLTPDLPLHDPELGFEERIRQGMNVIDAPSHPRMKYTRMPYGSYVY